MLCELLIVIAAARLELGSIIIDATIQTPISPYIYGANFPDWKGLELPFPFVRQGGNRMTAYNWETNASNAGNDYRNQNDGYMSTSDTPGLVGKISWRSRSLIRPPSC